MKNKTEAALVSAEKHCELCKKKQLYLPDLPDWRSEKGPLFRRWEFSYICDRFRWNHCGREVAEDWRPKKSNYRLYSAAAEKGAQMDPFYHERRRVSPRSPRFSRNK